MIPTQEDFEKLRSEQAYFEDLSNKLNFKELMDIELENVMKVSHESDAVYPSQGLLLTPFDYLSYSSIHMLPIEKVRKALTVRLYFLLLFNHPYRIKYLVETEKKKFTAPKKISSKMFDRALAVDMSLSISDIGASVTGSERVRVRRTERYAQGPFVKVGKHARIPLVGSSSPDVWNSALAISTMAASHALTCIPRNGILSSIKRQCDLAVESFSKLQILADFMYQEEKVKNKMLTMWKNNVVGTIEADPEKALHRVDSLMKVGVKSFRVYSPEPGDGPVKTVRALRKEFGSKIEIFTGQIISEKQAMESEAAGADGLYIGIGGGGRCTTGVRSGSVIDWPTILWSLRGKINIPVIVEGGASDHIATTLLLGATGIGVSRSVAGGTIESPGGALYLTDKAGKMFKPYGGEASARTKYLENKMLPFNIPSFVEGETTKAYIDYTKHIQPTLVYNIHNLLEDVILALVFRNVNDITELQSINPSPLRRNTMLDIMQRETH